MILMMLLIKELLLAKEEDVQSLAPTGSGRDGERESPNIIGGGTTFWALWQSE
jgi:hypothetical protein